MKIPKVIAVEAQTFEPHMNAISALYALVLKDALSPENASSPASNLTK